MSFSRYEIANLLIDAKADVNAADKEKETPLHEATAYGAVGVTQVSLWHLLLGGPRSRHIADSSVEWGRCQCQRGERIDTSGVHLSMPFL